MFIYFWHYNALRAAPRSFDAFHLRYRHERSHQSVPQLPRSCQRSAGCRFTKITDVNGVYIINTIKATHDPWWRFGFQAAAAVTVQSH